MPASPAVTRLAPSPTGALHLGNARTFLINWLLARQNHWRILLRIDDLDGPGIKPEADVQTIEDLRWIGLDYDDIAVRPSARASIYANAIAKLLASGSAYPCTCTRAEIAGAARAPHATDNLSIYPGTCRDRYPSLAAAHAASGRPPAIRFRASDRTITFTDACAGPQSFSTAALGDFPIQKNDGTAAYQLAVVLDDADDRVTHVVRGDDLLESTPRQIQIYHALGLSDHIPAYTHLPLIVGPDGRRLAKRHGDTRLSHYRAQGVPPARILQLLARLSAIPDSAYITHPADLLQRFSLAAIPPARVSLTAADEAFLLAAS